MGVCGEIGKHNRLKICRPYGLAGSSPARRTTLLSLTFYYMSLSVVFCGSWAYF